MSSQSPNQVRISWVVRHRPVPSFSLNSFSIAAGLGRVLGMLRTGHPEAADGQAAARRQRVAQSGGDPRRVLVIVDVVQDGQQQPNRLAGVDEVPHRGIVKNLVRLSDVGGHEHRFLAVGQQSLGVRAHHRVVVHEDDRGDFVHVCALASTAQCVANIPLQGQWNKGQRGVTSPEPTILA